jgi:DnaJ-class molecular chaperone
MSDTYDDRFIRINNRLDSYEQALETMQSFIHNAIGPCIKCNGSGHIYDAHGEEGGGIRLTSQCDSCKGTGKLPLDFVKMMEHFKEQAKTQVQTETDLPF